MNDEMIVRSLKALGDPTRMHIVAFLSNCCCNRAAVRDDGDVEGPTAGEVCCHVTGAEKINSTISHHLHELAEAGVITMEKRGKTSVCTLNPSALISLADHLQSLAKGENQNVCC